jgi:hypothetical protein
VIFCSIILIYLPKNSRPNHRSLGLLQLARTMNLTCLFLGVKMGLCFRANNSNDVLIIKQKILFMSLPIPRPLWNNLICPSIEINCPLSKRSRLNFPSDRRRYFSTRREISVTPVFLEYVKFFEQINCVAAVCRSTVFGCLPTNKHDVFPISFYTVYEVYETKGS